MRRDAALRSGSAVMRGTVRLAVVRQATLRLVAMRDVAVPAVQQSIMRHSRGAVRQVVVRQLVLPGVPKAALGHAHGGIKRRRAESSQWPLRRLIRRRRGWKCVVLRHPRRGMPNHRSLVRDSLLVRNSERRRCVRLCRVVRGWRCGACTWPRSGHKCRSSVHRVGERRGALAPTIPKRWSQIPRRPLHLCWRP